MMTDYTELITRLRKQRCQICPICHEAADAIEELSDTNVGKWTSIKDGLPEERINPNTQDFEYVLCATIFGDVRPLKYGKPIGHKEAHFWNEAGYVDAYITHWQPLPEPPKEEI